jgi:hypothetical protein
MLCHELLCSALLLPCIALLRVGASMLEHNVLLSSVDSDGGLL